ncbi:helix-turn-helix domain-containing protein [Qipengyuania sp. S6317L1]|uniref:helix-turn-helix domain-containing protein n=1 Tax=Qipengyuania sp. S6317L1 TaxID=2926410 RepID=UPI001FF1ED46|nr:helix-turn-helix domain-containing protein [Qipengyuania sp. S6317L1]MCK0098509.1 helix-turn-helix domain-containing protein [Qipengyuania sp. S6317L1]
MEPLLVSINEAAKALNLGRSSIYELIKQDKLDTRKMGRRRMVTTASIRRLVDGEE